MSLLVVGTVAFDAIETPFGKTDKIVGGAATYIGLSASKFSQKINLVSVVGDDFPSDAIEMLKNHSVDTNGLQIKKGEKTFFWSGRYHNNMNTRDTIDTQLNVLETFDPVVPEQYKDCQILMLGNLMPMIQQQVFNQLTKKPELTVLDTMNFWMDNCMDELMEALKHVDVLTINDEEARQLSGEYSLVVAAKKIMSFGPKPLSLKKESMAHCFLTVIKNSSLQQCHSKMFLIQLVLVILSQVDLSDTFTKHKIFLSTT